MSDQRRRAAVAGAMVSMFGCIVLGESRVCARDLSTEPTEVPGNPVLVLATEHVRKEGFAQRMDGGLMDQRFITFAISHVSPPAGADPRDAVYSDLTVTRGLLGDADFAHVRTIDLSEGYAYMKMGEVPPLSAIERIMLVLSDGPGYAPVVTSWIERRLARAGAPGGALPGQMAVPDLEPLFPITREWFIRRWGGGLVTRFLEIPNRQLEGELDVRGVQELLRQPLSDRVRELLHLLSHADPITPGDRNRAAFLFFSVTAEFTHDQDVLRYMDILYFPFMRSRRTVAGAEGTEVVVYTPEAQTWTPPPPPPGSGTGPGPGAGTGPGTDPNDPSDTGLALLKGEVWYFFLHSPNPDPIVIAGDWWNQTAQTLEHMQFPVELELKHAARVPVRQVVTSEGGLRWVIDGQPSDVITKYPLAVHLAGTDLDETWAHLWDVLQQAHADACAEALEPASPIELARGRQLSCPAVESPAKETEDTGAEP